MKILYLVTEDWYFWSHRLPIARAARDAGYEVVIATRVAEHGEKITAEGFKLIGLKLDRRNKNPIVELPALMEIIRIYRSEKPDIVHHVALKPIIYGSIAAYIARIPATVNALAGLGHLFTAEGLKASIGRAFMKNIFGLLLGRKRTRTIFQNPDDLKQFVKNGIVNENQTVLIKGSGVDTDTFKPTRQAPEGDPIILLSSRMIRPKGMDDFVEAAKILKERGVKARFVMVGKPDPGNPESIPEKELSKWNDEKAVEYWGYRSDIIEVLQTATIVVLPSVYGEGVPKSLIEAAACEKPIVAYDIPGSREIVRHEVNGLLVPVREVESLADAICKLLEESELCKRMGREGRKIVEREFSEKNVTEKTLSLYRNLAVD